jgi:hypothetical protein
MRGDDGVGMGRRRSCQAAAHGAAVRVERAPDDAQRRAATIRASHGPLGIGAPGASSHSWSAGFVSRQRSTTDAAPRSRVGVAGGTIHRVTERRGARPSPHVLLTLGHAGRRGQGYTGTRGASGPCDDSAIYARDTRCGRRCDSIVRSTHAAAAQWRHCGDGQRGC